MFLTRLTALLLSGLIFAVTGCGGSGSNTTTANVSSSTTSTSAGTTSNVATNTTVTSPPLSRAALITSANSICKRLHAQLKAFSAQKQNIEHLYMQAASDEQAALAKLHRLNAPTDLTANWNQILNAMSTLAADSAKYAEDSRTKNLGAASNLSASYGPIKRPAVAVAVRDGLTECGLAL